MKALVASDLHGNHAVYEWLVTVARVRSIGALILAGDLLGCPDIDDDIAIAQKRDAAAIMGILAAMPIPVYYIMGNDDLVELDPSSEQFMSIHGRRVDLGRFNLVGYQYSLPFMGGVFEKPEEAIIEDLARIEPLVDDRTVLVTHSPALGVLDTGILGIHAGSRAIMDLTASRNVRAHVHGHIHECFGRSDRHFNVAAGGRRRAMIIDFETMEASVEQGGEGEGP